MRGFGEFPGARAKDWGHHELDLGPGERRKPGLSGLPARVVFGDERDELETASLASRAGQCVDPEPPLRAAGYSSADLDLRHAFLDNEFLAYRRDQKCLVYQQPTLPVTMKQWDKGKVTITFHAKTTHTGAHARINVFNIVDDQGNPAWAGGAEFFDPVPLNTTWTKHTITMLASDPDFLAPIHSLEFRLGLIQGSAPSEVEAWFDDFDIHDALQWNGCGGDPRVVEITEDGLVLVDSDPMFLSVAWGGAAYTSPSDLDGKYAALGQNGRGFTGIIPSPAQQRAYSSKRELLIMLAAAECPGMMAVPWVPIYGFQGASQKWPSHKGYLQEWIQFFNEHPALFGWMLTDEMNYGETVAQSTGQSKHEQCPDVPPFS